MGRHRRARAPGRSSRPTAAARRPASPRRRRVRLAADDGAAHLVPLDRPATAADHGAAAGCAPPARGRSSAIELGANDHPAAPPARGSERPGRLDRRARAPRAARRPRRDLHAHGRPRALPARARRARPADRPRAPRDLPRGARAPHRRPQTACSSSTSTARGVNDTQGHQDGDRVLRRSRARLAGALRRGDKLYRTAATSRGAAGRRRPGRGDRGGPAPARGNRRGGLGVTVSVGAAVPFGPLRERHRTARPCRPRALRGQVRRQERRRARDARAAAGRPAGLSRRGVRRLS